MKFQTIKFGKIQISLKTWVNKIGNEHVKKKRKKKKNRTKKVEKLNKYKLIKT